MPEGLVKKKECTSLLVRKLASKPQKQASALQNQGLPEVVRPIGADIPSFSLELRRKPFIKIKSLRIHPERIHRERINSM